MTRFAYVDEAGISESEPFAVVAAVLVHGDRQVKGLERALDELADQCVLPSKRVGFIFHALELFNGGKTLDRENYPRGYRHPFLRALVELPADNGMDVAMHFIEKSTMTGDFRPNTARERATLYHAMAFIGCAAALEMRMRSAYPDEICQIIAEDNSQSRARIREAHAFLASKTAVAGLPDDIRGLLPFQHIVHATLFAAKSEAPGLQLADAAAFAIRRHLEQKDGAAEFYDPLVPALINRPQSDFNLKDWG